MYQQGETNVSLDDLNPVHLTPRGIQHTDTVELENIAVISLGSIWRVRGVVFPVHTS